MQNATNLIARTAAAVLRNFSSSEMTSGDLVSEYWIRVDDLAWRGDPFTFRVMRSILIDEARRQGAGSRAPASSRLELIPDIEAPGPAPDIRDEVLEVVARYPRVAATASMAAEGMPWSTAARAAGLNPETTRREVRALRNELRKEFNRLTR